MAYQTGLVEDGCSRLGDLEDPAIGEGVEETEERYFVGQETWIDGGRADGGDLYGPAGEGCLHQAMAESGARRERECLWGG